MIISVVIATATSIAKLKIVEDDGIGLSASKYALGWIYCFKPVRINIGRSPSDNP
jgi:hypothetical protein